MTQTRLRLNLLFLYVALFPVLVSYVVSIFLYSLKSLPFVFYFYIYFILGVWKVYQNWSSLHGWISNWNSYANLLTCKPGLIYQNTVDIGPMPAHFSDCDPFWYILACLCNTDELKSEDSFLGAFWLEMDQYRLNFDCNRCICLSTLLPQICYTRFVGQQICCESACSIPTKIEYSMIILWLRKLQANIKCVMLWLYTKNNSDNNQAKGRILF